MDYNHNILNLSENFKRICDDRGIKYYSLVNAHITKNTIEGILEGRKTPAIDVYEVAKALGVTVEELLTGEPPQAVHEAQAAYGKHTKEEEQVIDLILRIMREPGDTPRKTMLEWFLKGAFPEEMAVQEKIRKAS